MSATATTAELGGTDLDDFDASVAKLGIGVFIAIVSHDHTGLQGNHVVGVIPLLTRRGIGIASGFYDVELVQAERFLNHGDDFALSVEQTERNSEYSHGAEFDSSSVEATVWYVRSDEEGEPIHYDYEGEN